MLRDPIEIVYPITDFTVIIENDDALEAKTVFVQQMRDEVSADYPHHDSVSFLGTEVIRKYVVDGEHYFVFRTVLRISF